MMAELLKGAPAAAGLIEKLNDREEKAGRQPKLVLIGTDADPSLVSYGKSIRKMAERTNVGFEMRIFPADTEEEVFLQAVKEANEDPGTDGVLLSMPLPKRLSFERIQAVMKPEKDVDGISLVNRALLYEGLACPYPCTAEAVFDFLAHYKIRVSGKRAVVVGRSPVVGRPVAMGLLALDATVTVCHTKTKKLHAVTREADLLITATGSAGLIRKKHVKPGAVVIDLGMAEGPDGKIVGDVDLESVGTVASKIAPSIGGVGVLTTAILLEHTVKAFENSLKHTQV